MLCGLFNKHVENAVVAQEVVGRNSIVVPKLDGIGTWNQLEPFYLGWKTTEFWTIWERDWSQARRLRCWNILLALLLLVAKMRLKWTQNVHYNQKL